MSVHDANYTKLKKELGIPTDEPIFVLRAQDKLSMPTLARYRNFANETVGMTEGDPWFENIDEVIRQFTIWQQDNAAQVKLPD